MDYRLYIGQALWAMKTQATFLPTVETSQALSSWKSLMHQRCLQSFRVLAHRRRSQTFQLCCAFEDVTSKIRLYLPRCDSANRYSKGFEINSNFSPLTIYYCYSLVVREPGVVASRCNGAWPYTCGQEQMYFNYIRVELANVGGSSLLFSPWAQHFLLSEHRAKNVFY